MSDAAKYKKALGKKVEAFLGGEFKFFASALELRRRDQTGTDIIRIGGKNKYSPFINVQLGFGRRFEEAKKYERLLKETHPLYHVAQESDHILNYAPLDYAGPTRWEIDIRVENEQLPKEMARAIEHLAFPFFEKFQTLQAAQADLELTKGSWNFSPHWKQLFYIDVALSQVDRFESWALENLDEFQKKLAIEHVKLFRESA
ncbi:MAG: hypothetical protein KZQ75_10825 [Candidatus Thiodiazotropha sp. (ex Myrtea spinifera)]|nr:hypothetical protein [Candidatus Thiodiazotropha sp. (ex Myrtea spinifera)]MCU7829074.1 hypothetical protein [Candidatus Thiodiazotropha sp. (ex Myrtea sp. 'scaly one' KF741663)]